MSTTVTAGAPNHTGLAKCPGSLNVVGGGAKLNAGGSVLDSHPYDRSPVIDGGDADDFPDDGWMAQVSTTVGATFIVYAICVAATSVS